MKRLTNLLTKEKVTVDFCRRAIYEAAENKHYRSDVRKILSNADNYAEKIRDMLLDLTFYPSPYGYETRMENGKERHLQKPRFYPDQIVHHVLIMLIYDKIIKRIDPHAVASIKDRGTKSGLRLLKYWIQERHKRETTYCGKGDIHHCFESITPDVAYQVYADMIKDKNYMEIMHRIIYSWDSLPLGNYLSGFTLNLLLKNFDEAIRRVPCVTHYLRYMDDFVFFSSNRRKTKVIKEVIEKELAKIGLKLKGNYQVFKVDDRGVDMLGYRVFRHYTILRKRVFVRTLKQVRQMQRHKDYSLYSCMSLMSRLGYSSHCYNRYLMSEVGKLVNTKLVRNIISNEYKRRSKNELFIPKDC